MARRLPGAVWRPLGTQAEPRLSKKNKIVLHTMVGTLTGTDAYFRRDGYGGVESHLGTSGYGTTYQWQDFDYQADAQLEGNDDCISWETADHGEMFPSWSGSNVPAWTEAQVDEIVAGLVWLCREFDIPPVLCPDVRDGTKGIAYHRMGVDPWRCSACELYSSAYGKVCPGDRRIAQLKNIIIPRVARIINGEDDMDVNDVKTLANTDNVFKAPPSASTAKDGSNPYWALNSHITGISDWTIYRIPKMLEKIIDLLDRRPYESPGVREWAAKNNIGDVSARRILEYLFAYMHPEGSVTSALQADLDALKADLAELSDDEAKLTAAVDALKAELANANVEVAQDVVEAGVKAVFAAALN